MKKSGIVLAVVAVIGLMIFGCIFPYITAEDTTFIVKEKERITTGSGDTLSHKYLVFTEHETFENVDCFVRFKFGSSDLQGKLTVGKTYKALVYGWRIPFLSAYRNIVKVTEIQQAPTGKDNNK